ncbi:unnamed protein product [Brachionus calyciflorus]|uniref:Uncharacterized protein n=1 Tax=Brachionus calyciflorus TaxID=104777 RepID=A0A814J2Y8_9BILA|nr:unnamed protein product [Brachionus calyciflorus]
MIPLYDQMQQNDDESESDEEFDYINGIRNNTVLDQINLTKEDIQNEIYRFWQSFMLTRKRVTDHDVELA